MTRPANLVVVEAAPYAARRGRRQPTTRSRSTGWRSRTRTFVCSFARTAVVAKRLRARRPVARRSPRRATGSSCTRTSRRSSTRGTSTRSISRRAQDCPPAESWSVVSHGAAARRDRVRARDRRAKHAAPGRAARRGSHGASSSTRRSTGTRSTSCSRCASRSLCTRRTRPTRCRSATRSDRRTTRRASTARATRCPAIAWRISPSTASAPRCSPTRSTATAVTATSCASACCAHRRAPILRRTWDATSSLTRSSRTPAAGARRASSRRGCASTRRCAGRTARSDVVVRVRRRSEPRARHDQARASDSDSLVLRLYEAHGARGIARVRLARPVERARLANALEEATGDVDGRGRRARRPVPPARGADGAGRLMRVVCAGLATRDTIWRVPAHPRPTAASSRASSSSPAAARLRPPR